MAIIEAGFAAIDTHKVVSSKVKLTGKILKIGNNRYNLAKYKNVYVVGIGKASHDAAEQLEKILGSKIAGGVVLDVKAGKLKRVKCVKGSHPYPSQTNIKATGEIIRLLNKLDETDLVITIISGGGSALLCQPYKLQCGELVLITRALMKAGASIQELNTVRKHLSVIQGGQMARMAYPATVVGLIFSDVPGDDLSVVASGPTVVDKTTVADARAVLDKYHVLKAVQMSGVDLTKTPKDPLYFKNVKNHLLVCNSVAAKAMQEKSKELGYKARVLSTRLTGEAVKVGRRLATSAKAGEAVIAAGETTVVVTGNGQGGRNQELVLGALAKLPDDALIVSVASDGIDNTPVAGALVDETVQEAVAKHDVDPKQVLARNDSYTFFQKIGNQIKTGVTGANVSDLILVLREPKTKK